ncbi:MAG: RNA polymerase sigma factor [Patescibacteria group bacterium]
MKAQKSNFPENKESVDLNRVSGFSLVYDQYSPLIWKHIFLRVSLKEEANDLTAEVFLKTWEYLKSGRKIRQIKPFLYRAANNLVIDWYRSRKKIISLDQDLADQELKLEVDAKAEQKLIIKEELRDLMVKLDLLREKEKALLVMRFVDGLEIDEIAKILGKSKGAVRVGLHRALKSLTQADNKPK